MKTETFGYTEFFALLILKTGPPKFENCPKNPKKKKRSPSLLFMWFVARHGKPIFFLQVNVTQSEPELFLKT